MQAGLDAAAPRHQRVFAMHLVRARPFYGYHPDERLFVKILMWVRRAPARSLALNSTSHGSATTHAETLPPYLELVWEHTAIELLQVLNSPRHSAQQAAHASPGTTPQTSAGPPSCCRCGVATRTKAVSFVRFCARQNMTGDPPLSWPSTRQAGAVFGKRLQPYEAHIPFHLQIKIDLNLAGMSWLRLSEVLLPSATHVDSPKPLTWWQGCAEPMRCLYAKTGALPAAPAGEARAAAARVEGHPHPGAVRARHPSRCIFPNMLLRRPLSQPHLAAHPEPCWHIRRGNTQGACSPSCAAGVGSTVYAEEEQTQCLPVAAAGLYDGHVPMHLEP